MKRKFLVTFLAILGALCLAFGFTGCGETKNDETGKNPPVVDPSGDDKEQGDNEQGGTQKPSEKEITVTYDANGGEFGDGGSTFSQTVKEGSKLTAPSSPVRKNYTFKGWARHKSGSFPWKFEENVVSENTTLFAQWSETSADILRVEGASIEGKKIFMFVDHTTGEVSLSGKVSCSDDAVWRLYSDPEGRREISTKTVTDLGDGDNTYYIAVNFQNQTLVNLYEITIYRSYLVTVSYYDGTNLLETAETYTGDTFTAEYKPDITGYTFNGWNAVDGRKFTSDVLWAPLSLYADKTANRYKANLNVNGGNELTETEKTVTYGSEYSLPVPKRAGYSFMGWYLGSVQLTNASGKSLSVWNYTTTQDLTARWEANKYTVTLTQSDSEMGTVSGGGDHAFDSQVTITASSNLGYNFIGWYKGEEEVSKDPSFRFTMGMGNVTFEARWEVDPLLENFIFVSTPTTCMIADVKNTSRSEIVIPDYVTEIKRAAFAKCDHLTSITIPFVGARKNTSKDDYQYPFGYIFGNSHGNAIDENSDVPKTLLHVTVTGGEIFDDAFYTCSGVASVTIGKEVTSIGSMAFADCSGLKRLTFEEDSKLTEIGDYAFWDCSGLSSITIPDSVTSIGSSAFAGCKSLTWLTIGSGVTWIGNYAFSGCQWLGSIDIPDSVTSIGSSAFAGCKSLTWLTIGSGVTSIGVSAFSGCSRLQSVVWNAGNYIGYSGSIFADCTNLRNLTFGDNVKTIPAGAFAYCRGLTGELKIPNGVTSIGSSAFEYCSGLTGELKIPDSVTSIGYGAFHDCSGLTGGLKIPDGVTEIESNVFWGCSGLTGELKIPASVTSIGDHAFYGCGGLTGELKIPDGVTSIGDGAFYGCGGLTGELKIPDGVTVIESDVFSGCSGLTSIDIPDSVTEIGDSAFEGCTSLESIALPFISGVNIPDSLKEVTVKGGEIPSYAFNGYNSLVTIVLGDGVTSIGDYAFYGCGGLTGELKIPDGVTSIGDGAFYGCSGLTGELKIPDGVTSIGYSAFYGCSGLTGELKIPNGVTVIESDAFRGCSGLNSVTIGSGVTSIGDYAFSGCSGLNSVTIGSGVTEIRDYAFSGCYKLIEVWNYSVLEIKPQSFDFGNVAYYAKHVYQDETPSKQSTVDGYRFYEEGEESYLLGYAGSENKLSLPAHSPTGKNYAIYQSAFDGCRELTSVTIPDSVTSIGWNAFHYCSGLTGELKIPASVTSIGDHAFYGCGGLTGELKIPDGVTEIGDNAFRGCSGLTKITIPDSVTAIGSFAFHDSAYYNDDSNWDKAGVLYVGNHLIAAKDTISKSYSIRGGTKTIAGNAFSGCSRLTSIVIPDGVTSIGGSAFSGCSGLTSVTIGSGVTSIGIEAFEHCSRLKEVTIPDSVTWIGDGAFSGCSGMTALTIGRGVTSIRWNVFGGCSGLKEVTIPDSVTAIGKWAFNGCSGLKKVHFENPNGWKVLAWVYAETLDDTKLRNPETAAEYLTDTYYDYYWKREG